MKSIVAFLCCLGLSVSVAVAKQNKNKDKEEEGKHGQGKQGKHAQQMQSHAIPGKHVRQFNAEGHGTGPHGAKRRMMTESEGNGPDVHSGTHAGRKAEIKHFDFANERHTTIKTVKFRENYRIIGAEHWTGERYVVFRNYRSVWHDHGWWTAHYPRVVLIGGGWYFWNAGFWYPAWGYDPGASSYAYDGPIYAYNDLPPDQVVANVQTELQTQGYYHGEVDGMLGPLTRAALADYQRDHGLYTTAAIDEPTMNSLGFS